MQPKRYLKKLGKLLQRANMNIFQWNTGVVRSTCKTGRIGVRTGAFQPWGDCVAVEILNEGSDTWRQFAFSPARARLIAQKLNEAAEYLEGTDPGMNCIDK